MMNSILQLTSMIPNKSNFKFQELTPITGVKPYVIRFWETEFDEIDPIDSDSGQKLYARKDVEAILRIKKLLFEDKLSIQEAKFALREGQSENIAPVKAKTGKDMSGARAAVKESLELIKEIKLKRMW